MRRELNLQPLTRFDPPLVFGWDDETGELWGPDAAYVARAVQLAMVSGFIGGMPGSGGVEPTDPLRVASELATLLSQTHLLPPDLQSLVFKSPSEVQVEGDIN